MVEYFGWFKVVGYSGVRCILYNFGVILFGSYEKLYFVFFGRGSLSVNVGVNGRVGVVFLLGRC